MTIKTTINTLVLSLSILVGSFAHANTNVIDAIAAQQLAKEQVGGGNPVGGATLKETESATPYYEVKLLMSTGEVRVVKINAAAE